MISGTLARALRYGENPHQKAAFYAVEAAGPSLARAEVLQGKELSYNNLLDLDAAMRLCAEFSEPAAAIIKHNTPCGAAISQAGVAEAYRRARDTDPVSAFGGIVAVNRPVDGELARELSETFLECVIAPAFAPEALALLAAKKNLRLLAAEIGRDAAGAVELRSVAGGFLVQTRDRDTAAAADAKVASQRQPTAAELRDLDFAWRVCKHVKSNAIVFAADGRTLGIGAGQMSRVDSVRIAVSKARVPLGRLGRRVRRLLPVPGRRRRGSQGGRALRHPAGRLDARRRIDRRRRRARDGDGHDRREALPALADMRVFLVGLGGREHALAWKIAASPLCERLVVAPGNPGIAGEPKVTCIPIAADAIGELTAAAVAERADLVVCGPEVALCAGLGDAMRAARAVVLRAVEGRGGDRGLEGFRQAVDGGGRRGDGGVRRVRGGLRRRGLHRRSARERGDQGRRAGRRQGRGGG